MGSSYFGEPKMGNNSSSSSSSSSRKGKKNNNSSESNKPKQPQRGLGVAQLEKIRLHGQMPSCAAYHHPPHHSLHPPNFPSTFNINDEARVQITGYSSSVVPSSTSYAPSNYAFHPNLVMGLPEYETTNIRYGDSQPRWEHPNAILESQSFAQPNVTKPFLNLYDTQHRSGSSSQNSESSDNQELDLELRLSL